MTAQPDPTGSAARPSHADLYRLPLGAGGHVVRRVGKVYEAVRARREHRTTRQLFHSAPVVTLPEGRFVIEQVPHERRGPDHGDVRIGPVGLR